MFGIVIVICIFYFDGEKYVLTKKRERERKKNEKSHTMA